MTHRQWIRFPFTFFPIVHWFCEVHHTRMHIKTRHDSFWNVDMFLPHVVRSYPQSEVSGSYHAINTNFELVTVFFFSRLFRREEKRIRIRSSEVMPGTFSPPRGEEEKWLN